MAFSATDAAFEGFRVVRRTPTAVIWWAGAFLIFLAVLVALGVAPFISLMTAAESLEGVSDPQPADFAPFFAAWAGLMLLLVPVGLLFGAVMNAAVVRAVLEPQRSAFGYLRVGKDELRVVVVSLVLAVMAGLASGVAWLALGLLTGLITAAVGEAGVAILVIGGIGLLVASLWVAARFCLAVPITVAEKRIAIFDSWHVTRGKGWPVLGMVILALIMTVVVSLLFSLVAFPITLALGMTGGFERLIQMEGAPPMEILQALGPFLAVSVVINAIGSALQVAVAQAPFSAAYRDLKG